MHHELYLKASKASDGQSERVTGKCIVPTYQQTAFRSSVAQEVRFISHMLDRRISTIEHPKASHLSFSRRSGRPVFASTLVAVESQELWLWGAMTQDRLT